MRLHSRRVALVCLLLTLSSALAFAAHHHSNAIEAAKCTGLYSRLFSLPPSSFHVAEGDVRFRIHPSARTRSFC